MSNQENQTPVLDPVAAAGATAQTSGFVGAGAGTSASEATIPASAGVGSNERRSSATTNLRSSFVAPTFPSSVSTGIFPTSAPIASPYGHLGGLSGGLQSSPNVPAPGTSIDPSTGKAFSAGLTRAELEAKKVSDLGGREQAARQLAGPGLPVGGTDTPGKELPGGWGRESPLRNVGLSASKAD